MDVMENISEFADGSMMNQTVTVYADKGHDAKYIRNYLGCNGMNCRISYKKNSRFIALENQNNILQQDKICR